MGSFNRFETTNPSIGRQGVTGERVDRMRFKVPNLRNVELTYPYFHDGSAATLGDVVTHYDGYLRLGLSADEQRELVEYLRSL